MTDASKGNEITADVLKTWSDGELAMAVLFAGIATGDVEAARVCKEAAERLKANKRPDCDWPRCNCDEQQACPARLRREARRHADEVCDCKRRMARAALSPAEPLLTEGNESDVLSISEPPLYGPCEHGQDYPSNCSQCYPNRSPANPEPK